MYCPKCSSPIDNNLACPQCGWDWSKVQWVLLGRFGPPSHVIIASLLHSQQIPVKTINQEVAGFPLSIGPLSETLIFIPEPCLEEARNLINMTNDSA